jgi:hypothetical protein
MASRCVIVVVVDVVDERLPPFHVRIQQIRLVPQTLIELLQVLHTRCTHPHVLVHLYHTLVRDRNRYLKCRYFLLACKHCRRRCHKYDSDAFDRKMWSSSGTLCTWWPFDQEPI